jgi:hypothetical protein
MGRGKGKILSIISVVKHWEETDSITYCGKEICLEIYKNAVGD